MYRMVDGELVEMTPEEEAEWVAQADAAAAAELVELRGARKDQVDQERERRLAAGFPVPDTDKHIQLDPISRANLNGAHSLAKDVLDGLVTWPADFAWRCTDNTFLLIREPTTMIEIAQTALAYYNAAMKTAWQHKDAIEVLVTAEEIEAYDITTGWVL